MSMKDENNCLYLLWKSKISGKQYLIGKLAKMEHYEFQYYGEVESAIKDGFTPLLCFPDLNKIYKNEHLFSIFTSRLPDRKRKNIQDILEKYGMDEYDEYMLLKRSGAKLPIDTLEFIDPVFFTNEKRICI